MSQVLEVGFSANDRIGNYRVEHELGPSGYGVLFSVRHLVLPRHAILKVVHSAFAAMQPFVLQTLREACILEAIAHPGVPIVYESGVLKDRRPWFAFEAIGGLTLEDVLAPGRLPVVEAAALLRDLVDVLEHAHRRGVIHRGLRPDRIVVTSQRRYPLCIPDWSEAMAHDSATQLPPAAPEGSVRYVAPELAHGAGTAGELIDDRVDMFALGVIAYRALTGSLPFAGVRDAVPHIAAHELRPDAPRELCSIIDSLLAIDRFDRPSASEVRTDVDWLFSTLPALQPLEPFGRTGSPDGTGAHGTHGTQSNDFTRIELRLRKPRWTPDVRHVETTDVDIAVTDSDYTK